LKDDPADRIPIVDAHQHFWDLERNYLPWLCDEPPIPFRYGDYGPIRKTYLPDDYVRDARGHDIVQTVYVETEWDPADPVGETRWVHEVHARFGLPGAIVAQARLDRPDVAEILDAHREFPLVRGIRHKPRAAERPADARRGLRGSMDDPAWRRGFARLAELGLSFDLQVPWWHLDQATDLAQDFPSVPIILNHTGLPADRSDEGLAGWRRALEGFAEIDHVFLKISGLGQPGRRWTVADNGPIVRHALGIFGVGRCMIGSNFPVDSLCATFDTIMTGFKTITRTLPPTERAALFAGNARRIYRIPDQPPAGSS
jgi:predicted TIM-barrel fold metal-dependent hydrolase